MPFPPSGETHTPIAFSAVEQGRWGEVKRFSFFIESRNETNSRLGEVHMLVKAERYSGVRGSAMLLKLSNISSL
jgi:hypothetical protein